MRLRDQKKKKSLRDQNKNSAIIYQDEKNRLYETKDVNTVPEAVPVWLPVRYISDTGQYRYTVSDLPLFYIYIYICMYVSVYIYIIIDIKVYHKTFPQFRTNYS